MQRKENRIRSNQKIKRQKKTKKKEKDLSPLDLLGKTRLIRNIEGIATKLGWTSSVALGADEMPVGLIMGDSDFIAALNKGATDGHDQNSNSP